MFENAYAVRFDRVMGVGRTKPILIACEDEVQEIEVVAKFSAGCAVGGLVREAMTAMLALDLGLPVPPPYLVELSPEFIDSIPDPMVAAFLRASDPFGFGSKRLPDGYATWVKPAGKMTEELEQEALNILAIDCWLTNSDRRITNPNLLTNGKSFAIFDHELALMTSLNLFWKEPWQANALEGTRPPEDHVFFEHLRGRAVYALDLLSTRFSSIPDARVDEYVAALPSSWTVETQAIASARSFIMLLRDNLIPAGTELTRALS